MYQAAIAELDKSIENIVNEASKLDRETIFIFMSDNGAAIKAKGKAFIKWFLETSKRLSVIR